MTIESSADGIRAIALKDLHVSTTGAQAERRKHFDKAAIAELAESIKTVGVLSPVLARPVNGHFELVFGERRLMAAKLAGLTVINASVRELTDDQVLEVQLIENLQREGLHELAEAEGYEQLQKLGHSADEIAEKVGKSRAYVYGRMKLLTLSKAARTAFYEGKLNASTALLLARIPAESLQSEALKELCRSGFGGEPMSYRRAFEYVHEHYMTRLSDAGFPTQDETLMPSAGTCGACPKRTGNQPQLFSDVKGTDVCTDPICFKAKRQAHAAREIARAEEAGRTVIVGKKAKEILPYGDRSVRGGFSALDDRPYQDPKNRTVAQLLGKGYEPILVQDPETGKLVKVAPESAVKAALKDAGVKSTNSSGSGTQSAAEKKAKLEKKFRAAVYGEMRDKFPTKLGPEDLRTIALRFYYEMQHDVRKLIMGLWQLEPVKSSNGYGLDLMKPVEKLLEGIEDAQLTRFLFDLVFIKDLQVHNYSNDKPTLLLATAKKLKVNAEKIRAELAAAAKPAKKAKGKKKA